LRFIHITNQAVAVCSHTRLLRGVNGTAAEICRVQTLTVGYVWGR